MEETQRNQNHQGKDSNQKVTEGGGGTREEEVRKVKTYDHIANPLGIWERQVKITMRGAAVVAL